MSMISKQVERLRMCAKLSRLANPSWSAEMLNAADTIEELAAKLHRANMERSITFCNDNWIPVEEKLPEEDVEVLLWLERFRYGNYNRMVQEYGIGVRIWDHLIVTAGGGLDEKWLAWQPLPKPYRGGEK